MRCRVAVLLVILFLMCSVAGAGVRYTITDLGNLGQRSATPRAVNDLGHCVGDSPTANGQRKAFFWSSDTGMIDLIPPGQPGTLPEGVAYAVNDAGHVVGYARPDQPAP